MGEVFYSFGNLFVVCEFAQRENIAFEECSDEVDQFDWYRFPTKIKQMMPLILCFAQEPYEVNCFGGTTLNRETYKVVSITKLN